MDNGVFGDIQDQQDTKSLHQELDRAMGDYSGSQLRLIAKVSIYIVYTYCIYTIYLYILFHFLFLNFIKIYLQKLKSPVNFEFFL